MGTNGGVTHVKIGKMDFIFAQQEGGIVSHIALDYVCIVSPNMTKFLQT
jgi:hypothetical protein